jgi:hypothetical protein
MTWTQVHRLKTNTLNSFLSKQEKWMKQETLSCIPDTGSSSHTWCDTSDRLLSSLYHHLHYPACSPNSLLYSHDYGWARGNNFADYSACGRDTGRGLHTGCRWVCSKGFQNKKLLTPKHSETEMVESCWERSKGYSGIIKTHDYVKPFPNASSVVASIHGHQQQYTQCTIDEPRRTCAQKRDIEWHCSYREQQ